MILVWKGVCCDKCLPETQATVAGGNCGVSEDLKPVGAEFTNQIFKSESNC